MGKRWKTSFWFANLINNAHFGCVDSIKFRCSHLWISGLGNLHSFFLVSKGVDRIGLTLFRSVGSGVFSLLLDVKCRSTHDEILQRVFKIHWHFPASGSPMWIPSRMSLNSFLLQNSWRSLYFSHLQPTTFFLVVGDVYWVCNGQINFLVHHSGNDCILVQMKEKIR